MDFWSAGLLGMYLISNVDGLGLVKNSCLKYWESFPLKMGSTCFPQTEPQSPYEHLSALCLKLLPIYGDYTALDGSDLA